MNQMWDGSEEEEGQSGAKSGPGHLVSEPGHRLTTGCSSAWIWRA